MSRLVKMGLMMLAEMRLAQRVGRIVGALKWAVLALVCGIGAGIALIAALWIFLIPRLGAEYAALSMAGVLGVLCAVFAYLTRATLHPHRKPRVEQEDSAAGEIKEMFAKHKGTALLSAIIAGLAMGTGKK
ncbi:MAG: hypothetical protein AB7E79_06465 [Rhodospirillaceae bacterium]